MPSTVILINTFCLWLSFSVGTALNVTLIYLIFRYTPKEMRVYSKILLQTCICDLLLLLASLLANPIVFQIEAGKGTYLNGIVGIQNPEYRIWGTLLMLGWLLVLNICLLGPLPQFIYRYLLLNWNKQLSLAKYLMMFAVICAISFIYCCAIGKSIYLPVEQMFIISNQQIAALLGLNVGDKILLATVISDTNSVLQAAFLLLTVVYALAYGTICISGWLMHRTVKNRPAAGQQQERLAELNRQVNKILFIQVTMPLIMSASTILILLDLLFSVADEKSRGKLDMLQQYFEALCTVPAFFLPTANPTVAIFIYKAYRRAFLDGFQKFCRKIKLLAINNNNNNNVAPIAPQMHRFSHHF